MCASIFCTILSEKFPIIRITERDMTTNVNWSSCKVPVIPAIYWRNLNFFDSFMKCSQISHFMKIRPGGAQVFHEDGWTDRHTHDEANSRYQKCLHHLQVGTWQNTSVLCMWPLTHCKRTGTLQAHDGRHHKDMHKKTATEWINRYFKFWNLYTKCDKCKSGLSFRYVQGTQECADTSILLPVSAPGFKPANKQTLQWSRCSDCELYNNNTRKWLMGCEGYDERQISSPHNNEAKKGWNYTFVPSIHLRDVLHCHGSEARAEKLL